MVTMKYMKRMKSESITIQGNTDLATSRNDKQLNRGLHELNVLHG